MTKQRTLVFCTAWAHAHEIWARRYQPWLQGIRKSGLAYDQILLIDDCSPLLPSWPDLAIIPADGRTLADKPLAMACFPIHLGKVGPAVQQWGWYRSFSYAARYARAGKFDKIVHIESDAFVISRRLAAYINALDTGWTTLWCSRHNFPEDNIQVIAGPSRDAFEEFLSRPSSAFPIDDMERLYPFSHIEQSFVGDRYGEYRPDIPRGADYAAQVRDDDARPPNYFWWLTAPADLPPAEPRMEALRGHIDPSEPTRITGWAQDVLCPQKAISIEVYAGGVLVGRVVANRRRGDLQAAGMGPHGFEIALPPGVRPPEGWAQIRRVSGA
jgi:hypothetical protein